MTKKIDNLRARLAKAQERAAKRDGKHEKIKQTLRDKDAQRLATLQATLDKAIARTGKRHWHHGTVAKRQAAKLQRAGASILPRAPLERYVRHEAAYQFKRPDQRFTRKAMVAFSEAADAYAARLLHLARIIRLNRTGGKENSVLVGADIDAAHAAMRVAGSFA